MNKQPTAEQVTMEYMELRSLGNSKQYVFDGGGNNRQNSRLLEVYQGKIITLQDQLNHLSQQVEPLKSENTALKNTILASNTHFEEQRQKLADCIGDVDQTTGESRELLKKIGEFPVLLEFISSDYDKVVQLNKDQNQQIAAQQERLAILEAEQQCQYAAIQNSYDLKAEALLDRISVQENTIQDKDKQIKYYLGLLSDENERVKYVKAQFIGQLGDQEAELAALKSLLQSKEQQIVTNNQMYKSNIEGIKEEFQRQQAIRQDQFEFSMGELRFAYEGRMEKLLRDYELRGHENQRQQMRLNKEVEQIRAHLELEIKKHQQADQQHKQVHQQLQQAHIQLQNYRNELQQQNNYFNQQQQIIANLKRSPQMNPQNNTQINNQCIILPKLNEGCADNQSDEASTQIQDTHNKTPSTRIQDGEQKIPHNKMNTRIVRIKTETSDVHVTQFQGKRENTQNNSSGYRYHSNSKKLSNQSTNRSQDIYEIADQQGTDRFVSDDEQQFIEKGIHFKQQTTDKQYEYHQPPIKYVNKSQQIDLMGKHDIQLITKHDEEITQIKQQYSQRLEHELQQQSRQQIYSQQLEQNIQQCNEQITNYSTQMDAMVEQLNNKHNIIEQIKDQASTMEFSLRNTIRQIMDELTKCQFENKQLLNIVEQTEKEYSQMKDVKLHLQNQIARNQVVQAQLEGAVDIIKYFNREIENYKQVYNIFTQPKKRYEHQMPVLPSVRKPSPSKRQVTQPTKRQVQIVRSQRATTLHDHAKVLISNLYQP